MPQNPSINVPDLDKIGRSPYFEARKLWKGRSCQCSGTYKTGWMATLVEWVIVRILTRGLKLSSLEKLSQVVRAYVCVGAHNTQQDKYVRVGWTRVARAIDWWRRREIPCFRACLQLNRYSSGSNIQPASQLTNWKQKCFWNCGIN